MLLQEETLEQKVITLRDMQKFAHELFDGEEEADKAAAMLKAILDARSPRLSDIAQHMGGTPEANYKAIQRFLVWAEPKKALNRLFMEEAEFVIADPTEIERAQAKKTDYVGLLKDGKTLGFQTLVMGVPYRGRAMPFHFITYSSATIGCEATSRNLEHRRALRHIKGVIGEKPVVMDREFSYQSLFEDFLEEGLNYVIRLNTGNRATITDEGGQKLPLAIAKGQKVMLRGVYYKGKVKVNLAGEWKQGFSEALWVISSLEPKVAVEIYHARMKLEESFKDLKSLLNLDKLMNKSRKNLEKMIAMVLLAYAIGLLVGEELRDRLHGGGGKMGALFGPVRAAQAAGKVAKV
jgi:hypothetical protein